MHNAFRQFTLRRMMIWVAVVAVCCALGPMGVAVAIVLTLAAGAVGLGSVVLGMTRIQAGLWFCAGYPWLFLGIASGIEWWARHQPPRQVGPAVFSTGLAPDSLGRTLPAMLMLGLPLAFVVGLVLVACEVYRAAWKDESRWMVLQILASILIPACSWIAAGLVILSVIRAEMAAD